MSRKLHSIVFAGLVIFVPFGVPAALAQGAGQRGVRRVAASQDNLSQLRTWIMGIKDEASLDAALTNLMGQGRLTKEQAAKIKTRWQKRQSQTQSVPAIARLRAIGNSSDRCLARRLVNHPLRL